MPRPYTQEDYEALARAVLAGMPEEEAERILEEQRKKRANGEEVYWLTLKEEAKTSKTTIQITKKTKAVLLHLTKYPNEPYEAIIKRIIEQAERVPALEKENIELKKKLAEIKVDYVLNAPVKTITTQNED